MSGLLTRLARLGGLDCLTRLAGWTAPLRERRCVICASPVAAAPGPVICPACAAKLLRRKSGHCSRCGELFSHADAPPAPCGKCLATERPWERFFFHGVYRGLLRDTILRFKNGHELALAAPLGGFLAAHPEITGPYDAIVPMPLHPKRLRERGFNQALELAKPLAARLGVPLVFDRMVRTGHTHPQAGLTLKERKMNVQGLFAANNVAGKRLLLVDDIATTCATLESAATELLRAGAAAVDVAVAARTPNRNAG